MLRYDSILSLASETGKGEDLDFTLQKRRIDEAFAELLLDLEALERVHALLEQDLKKGGKISNNLSEAHRDGYEHFQCILWKLNKKARDADSFTEDPSLQVIREITRKVRAVDEKSLLRSPSPPVEIKNRAEQETIHWLRMISLQENKIESLNRQIVDYEEKIAEQESQRQWLQVRSDRETDDQQNASQTVLVEMKTKGDGIVQRLKERVANLPHFETTPEYLSHLDQHELKRKRIAKLEVQLQLWIKKYDKFIGDPMSSLRALENKMGGLEEWKDTVFRPQEAKLQQLREQIDVLEATALEEKVEEMRKVHAVRVLQRAWKRTLEIKRAKKAKKSKKGKGKK